MKRLFFPFSLVLLFLVLAGCGKNIRLYGTVTFSDDDTPLPMGVVCFEQGNYSARGIIKPDGSYVVGSLSSNDGLLPGTYQVHITGAFKEVGTGRDGMPLEESLIDQKYLTPNTSGLVCEVPHPKGRYDISVDRLPAPRRAPFKK